MSSSSTVLSAPERLAALRSTGLLDAPEDPSFQLLAELARRSLRVPVVLISLVGDDRQFFVASPGLREPWASRRGTPLSHSFCRHTVELRAPLSIADAREHPLVRGNPAIEELGVVAYLGVPLLAPGALAIGTLCAIDHETRRWSEGDAELLELLAHPVLAEIRRHTLRATAAHPAPVPEHDRQADDDRLRRRHAEDAWLRLSSVLDRVSDGFLALDTDWNCVFLNRSGVGIVGLPENRILGRHVLQVFPTIAESPLWASMREAMETQRPLYLEHLNHVENRWFEIAVYPAPDGMSVFFREVTDVRRTAQALRESEERLRLITETLEQAFWLLDPERMRVLYVSPGFEKIWGLEAEALYRDPSAWQSRVHPDDVERVAEAASTVAERGFDLRYRLVRPDGAVRWIHDRAIPVRDAAGRVTRVAGIADDVTDQIATEEQLWHAQKLEVTGRLAGGIAHDFNNLLTAVRGYAALLEPVVEDDPDAAASLLEIQTAAERAAALTRHLLAFARKQVSRPRILELNRHLSDTLPLLRRMVGAHIDVSTVLGERLPPVRIDPSQLDQVITNLVVNARDAMREGGLLTLRTGRARIGDEEIRARPFLRAGEYVLLEVIDDGVGMPAEVRDRVFEPFFTTKPQGEGNGLGLSTVFGIVKQNDGFVVVESEPEEGSTFRVFLPPAPAQAAGAATAPADAAGAQEPRPGTVLVAEDEDGVRTLVARVLAREGFRVVEARDGAEALLLFQRDPRAFDLLLTDLLMPRTSGRTLLRRVRAIRPELPVVVMSGYTDPEGEDDPASGLPFLQKPFEPRQLVEALREAMRSAAASPRDGTA